MNKINIFREDYYRHKDTNESKERTKNRLIQLNKLGMEEVGVAEFGIKHMLSGLYLERVWRYTETEWDSYITWATQIIKFHKKNSNGRPK